MGESAQDTEGPNFNPADGEGDQVNDVPTEPGKQQAPSEPSETDASKERTEHLLPDSTTGDEGGSRFESNPN